MTFVIFPSPLRLKALKTDSQHRLDAGPRVGFHLLTQGTTYNRGQLCPRDRNSRSGRPLPFLPRSQNSWEPRRGTGCPQTM